MFSHGVRKNRCNRGGLVLNTVDNVTRTGYKNDLIARLKFFGFDEASKFIHEIIISDNHGVREEYREHEEHSHHNESFDDTDYTFSYPNGGQLISAFTWSETPQGNSYWSDIDCLLDEKFEKMLWPGPY